VQRFSVVGSTGSGKTTVAARLGEALDIPVLELDAVHWGADWTPAEREDLRARVAGFVAGEAWVVDGNYRTLAQDLVWEAADCVVWLDLPFRSNAAQLLARTFRRVRHRETLWAGNRESVRASLFSRDSILWWLVKTHRSKRRRYESDMTSRDPDHLSWVRLRSRREVEAWLESLQAS
jgi:adenylate kinase family enzyme